jgi:hypothetical protein
VVGALFDPAQFFRAYLAAYQFYLGIALGCFAILMVYHLTGGAWGFLIRRILEAGMRTLPLLAVLFMPIVGGVGYLYMWAQPETVAHDVSLQHKQIYLNIPFFSLRAVFFFAAWLIIAYFLSSWSRRQDQASDPALPRKLRLLSAPGLIVYGATITFASIDWVMSLEPHWSSTIFGPQFASGQLLSGQAFTLIVLGWLVARPPLAGITSPEVLNDLGNLLFTFLVIWAYMTFAQFMLIWIANLPEEISWYLRRSHGGWQGVAWAIFVLHFAVPFFLLLMRDIKRSPTALARVAGLLLFMQLVFMYFQIMPVPAFADSSLTEHWMDFVTPLGLGGLWFGYFVWQLRCSPILARHDTNRDEAIHLRQHDMAMAGP